MRCTLSIPRELSDPLLTHLFPGDADEHGAVIAAGVCETPRGLRLIARDLFLAKDGVDYVPGERGYRMLHANFVRDKILYCRENTLCYLAIHNHRGSDTVGFSEPDLASHERGYPALLDINKGCPVGGLVFAQNAIAGDIWLPGGQRVALNEAVLIGGNLKRLYPRPPKLPSHFSRAEDRQIRLYGEAGQYALSRQKVGVIGAGGVGALIVEYLAGLGVGEVVIADPDRMERYNRRRIPYSTKAQCGKRWFREWRRWWLPQAMSKVAAAEKFVNEFNANVAIKPLLSAVTQSDIAAEFKDCDFIFLAADTMQARLVFNALVFQYGIPGYQVGSKITHDKQSGWITDIFSVVRPVGPTTGCLLCNGLIDPGKLQDEALSDGERRGLAYVDEPDVQAPSVITLNARGASHAVDEFMLRVVGLYQSDEVSSYVRVHPHVRRVQYDQPRRDQTCPICGALNYSVRGKGDGVLLPVELSS